MEPSRDEIRRRQARRRKIARQRAQLRFLCGFLIILLAALLSILLLFRPAVPVLERVVMEAGSELEIGFFLTDAAKYGAVAAFTTDVQDFNTRAPGSYPLELTVKGKSYTTNVEIMDRTAPTGEAVEFVTDVDQLPDPSALVKNIQDFSDVTVEYASQPNISQGGKTTAQVRLTDTYGNSSIVAVPLLVIADKVPPVIEGAGDMEYYIGDSITYKAGITVTDDETEKPKLTVDNSAVDVNTPGTYPVIYTATDDVGNTASVTVQLTLKVKPDGYVEPDIVYDLAKKVLKDITTDDMTPMEVAFAIYRWTSTNIAYTGSSDKSSWTRGAYQAFTQRSGDCYNYFAAAKALYDVAGIDNVDVIKSDTSHSSHFWSLINLGDGWYHVDCTPRRNVGYFFMNTDKELEAYSVKNRNSHIFDPDAYPERATESVQDKIDYSKGKVRG